MIGGIGMCGRPYCCSQFLDDFQPVSTKMAKVQSLSLNPTKISGSCGRLMCCLRYEQEAYEDLIKKVPKQGAFVETKDGYGTAVQVNLLRQTVKVKLDDDGDDSLRLYKPNELCAVPGGRPKDGEKPVSVLNYVPEPEEETEEEDPWAMPVLLVSEETGREETTEAREERRGGGNRRGRGRQRKPRQPREETPGKAEVKVEVKAEPKTEGGRDGKNRRPRRGGNGKPNTVRVEAKPAAQQGAQPKKERNASAPAAKDGAAQPKPNNQKNRRGYRGYHGKPRPKTGAPGDKPQS